MHKPKAGLSGSFSDAASTSAETAPELATIVIDEKDFRLVRIEVGETGVRYVLEVTDGQDALGVQRWREFRTDSSHLRALFGYLIRVATKGA